MAAQSTTALSILILGGTRFLGLHVAERALAQGHRVTFFNRGQTRADLLPQVERLAGDRNGQLEALLHQSWDAVVDTSGYVPRHVRLSAQVLAPHVGQYVFISSVSVYAGFEEPQHEGSPVGRLADETVEVVDAETYGPLKALCEQSVEHVLASRATIIRPGLIVGPHDNTDRFTYWPARIARGGAFLAPGTPADPIQVIDVRDLAAFIVLSVEAGTSGTFNAVSSPHAFTMGGLVEACVDVVTARGATSSRPRAVWRSEATLASHDVRPWTDMPVWMPPTGEYAGLALTSNARALASGLTIQSLSDTVGATLDWHLSRPAHERGTLKAGLAPEKELVLLGE